METFKMPAKKFCRRCARPSFVEGMARVMDIGGSLNNYTAADFEQLHRDLRARRMAMPTGPEADAQAIRNAWMTVGNHLWEAMGQFQEAEQDKLCQMERI